MKLETFDLERIQSIWENKVKYNLTESGVSPLSVGDVLSTKELVEEFLSLKAGYSQTNGTPELRKLISEFYQGTTEDNILATCGGAEANFLATMYLMKELESRDEFIVMYPNYLQIHGICKMMEKRVHPFNLVLGDKEWCPDLEGLKSLVSNKTAGIFICNPNNPTGAILDESHLRAIADIAQDEGIWILSDEIYRGSEHSEELTPTMFDYYDKVMITNSLSKVYGLPGLRLGWIACSSSEVAKELWAYSDYTTIGPSSLSDWLATIVLEPELRERVRTRGRDIVHKHWGIMEDWLKAHDSILEYARPKAAAFCFPKYNLEIDSVSLVHRLIEEKSVLIAPGDHFGIPKHLRIGFGYSEENLRRGLSLISEIITLI